MDPSSSQDSDDDNEEGRPRRTNRDGYFRDVCLNTDALHPVIEHDPRLAADILVALLEPAPRRRNPHGGWALQEKLGMDRIHGWFTPSYAHGPFLLFLRTAPDEALDMALGSSRRRPIAGRRNANGRRRRAAGTQRTKAKARSRTPGRTPCSCWTTAPRCAATAVANSWPGTAAADAFRQRWRACSWRSRSGCTTRATPAMTSSTCAVDCCGKARRWPWSGS
jgi:hypothetical protein